MEEFKKGSKYSRDMVSKVYFGQPFPRNKGGVWINGYWQIDNMINPNLVSQGYTKKSGTNTLVVFMNIRVPGRTGHDYQNTYNKETNEISWFGRCGSHSKQSIFKKLIDGDLKGLFFARWDQDDPNGFLYLGLGKIHRFEDGHLTPDKNGTLKETIKLFLSCDDSFQILHQDDEQKHAISSFALEKYLEEFIVSNWKSLDLGKKYDLQEEFIDGKRVKFKTDTGEIDIFAISKDRKEHLVIELKRGRASDAVIGQITRYMGYIESEIANPDQKVSGLIIALEDDLRLKRSMEIIGAERIKFCRYKINFELI